MPIRTMLAAREYHFTRSLFVLISAEGTGVMEALIQ